MRRFFSVSYAGGIGTSANCPRGLHGLRKLRPSLQSAGERLDSFRNRPHIKAFANNVSRTPAPYLLRMGFFTPLSGI